MDKKKIFSSLALAGIMTASVLGTNVNATTEKQDYLKPVGVYQKLVEGELVVPYVLHKNTFLTAKDIKCEFANVETIGGKPVAEIEDSFILKTGDTFKVKDNTRQYTIIIYGDVNGDGRITTLDASMIQKIALKDTNTMAKVSKFALEAADVVNDVNVHNVTTMDAARVQKYVLGIGQMDSVINQLPPVEDVTPPVIHGITNGDRLYINLNDAQYETRMPTVTATDDYDGAVEVVMTGEVKIAEEGEYAIIYTATDTAGNQATATLTVVVDNQAPELKGITDGEKFYLKINNSDFTLPEVTAEDAVDGEVTVTKTGTFDVTTEGEYEIVYEATDSIENKTTATVTVVVDGTAPKADVNYSTTVLTKEDVMVTIISDEPIQAPEDWELAEDGLSMKKLYTGNVNEKLMVSDLAGNETEAQIIITNIDKEVTATPSYSTTNPTKGSVIATITSDEVLQEIDGWDLASDKMSMTKEYTQNVIEDVMVKDMLGNQTTVTINIQNIDHVAPKAEVQYDVTELTNGNVQVTIIANEKLQAVTGISTWQLDTENPTRATATFTANGTEDVTVTDLAGNDAIIPVTVSNIDKTAPVLTTEYNITSLTNQNVMATIKGNEKLQALDGWDLAEDGLSMSKEYSANISEDVKVKDLAGNEAIATITIANIDKEAPVVEGLTEGKTSYQTVTLKFTEGVATLQKDDEAPQKYVSETPITVDGNYVLVVTDPAGNTTTKEFIVDNVAPVFEETLEPVILKKGDTFDTSMVANDAVDGEIPASLKITLNTNEVTQIDTTGAQDGEYILTYTATDEAGNTATATRTVTVDATPAKRVGQVKYSETSATTEVIARVTFDEKVEAPKTDSEWVPVDENQLAFTKKYTANVNETVIFTDMAGNETKVNIVINNIDSDVPSYSIDYDIEEPTNGTVTVTIAAGEELQPVNGWTLSADKLSMKKTYTENKTETVIIKDLAGNQASVLVEVDNIDKVAPTPSVSYSETNPTTQNVIVTIVAGEELQVVEGWKLAQDKCSMEKTYTQNTITPETITVKDLAGNEATVTVNVNMIDREAPTVTGVEDGKSYQTVTPVFTDPNGPITATLQKGTEGPIDFTSGTEVNEEGTYKLVVKDGLNNTITILFTIDTTVTINQVKNGERYTSVAPTFTEGTGELSKLDPENGDAVISTILYQSGTPITESGKYKLVVTDAAGNIATVTFIVDVTGPVITGVENNKTYGTNITPIVTTTGTIKSVVLKKNNEIVEGYTTSLGEITEEGSYELKVTDDLENTSTVKFIIDKTAPEVSGVEMNGEYKTVTPIFTEGTATLQKTGGEKNDDFVSGTKLASDGEYTLVVTDEVGNARTIIFKIDNVAPEITGIMDGEIYTLAVTPVNAAGDVANVILIKDGVEDKTYTTLAPITADGKYQLTVADKAGNTTTIEFEIDTQVKGLRFTTENNNKPTKDSVMVTIKAEEKLKPVTGWALSKDALSMTKVYEDNKTEAVTVFDLVGNSETLTIVVEGIDKMAPTAEEPFYSETAATKEPVTVIIEASEPIQEVDGWKLSDDKQTLTKIFINNATETVKIIDLAGNQIETPIEITVDNIYLTDPVITGMFEKEEITLPKNTGKVELPNVTATDAKGQTIAVTTSIKQIISEVNIKEVSEINLAIPGDYTVTYTAQDAAGNTTEVIRIIHIVE